MGTSFKPFVNYKNIKVQKVKTITYQKEYNSILLSNFRLQDYILLKTNKFNNPNIQNMFSNYERTQSCSAPMNTMNTMGGQKQNTFGVKQQNKGILNTKNIMNPIPFGQKQTTGGLFYNNPPQNSNQFGFNNKPQQNLWV